MKYSADNYNFVIPAQAGIQCVYNKCIFVLLDSRLRENDEQRRAQSILRRRNLTSGAMRFAY